MNDIEMGINELLKRIKQNLAREATTMAKEAQYWYGDLPEKDDFGIPYTDTMIDGRTRQGPWANMTPKSWRVYGCGFFGTGNGQKYKRQPNGKWLKVEG